MDRDELRPVDSPSTLISLIERRPGSAPVSDLPGARRRGNGPGPPPPSRGALLRSAASALRAAELPEPDLPPDPRGLRRARGPRQLPLPGRPRAIEERPGGDRYLLPFSADISLSLKCLERTIRELTHEIELRVVDVSERGFGIIISAQNKRYFQEHDHFWLRAVDQRELRTPILGEVCYAAPKGQYLRRGDVLVGLSLTTPLQREVLEGLKKHCLLVLSA
jgi:hypothetical protein